MGSIEDGKIEEGSNQSNNTDNTLPPLSEEQFYDIMNEIVPNDDRDDRGFLTAHAKDIVDTVFVWWRDQSIISKDLERVCIAPNLPNIPSLEAQEADRRVQSVKHFVENINVAINILLRRPTEKRMIMRMYNSMFSSSDPYADIVCIAEKIKEYDKRYKAITQAVAICEGISEGNTRDLSDNEIRQRIAQYAWEELIALVPYAKISNQRLTTKDELDIEKDDIRDSLKGSKWSTEKHEEVEKTYTRYIEQMKKGKYNNILINYFTELFNYTKGEIPENVSAIYILRLQETIFTGLYREDAFRQGDM